MKIKAKIVMALSVLLGATLAQAAIITSLNDTFGDGNIATNPDDGNGWTLTSNEVGGTGSISETNGQAVISTFPQSNNTTGIISNDQIDLLATDTLTVTWVIDSVTSFQSQGPQVQVGDVQWRVRPSGAGVNEILVNNGGNWQTYISGDVAQADVLDGFTVTMTADAAGLTFSTVGLGATADAAPIFRAYGASDFLTRLDLGQIEARLQGTGAGSTMYVNSITAAIPEPATLGLVGIAAAGMLFVRRRFRI